MQAIHPEILINARLVTKNNLGDAFEFILSSELQVVDCIKIESLNRGRVCPIKAPEMDLEGMLFELNHVRVNPRIDNSKIIQCLITAFKKIGVNVSNTPRQNVMSICFKPIGELSDKVRFYLNQEGKLIFLSPSTKPQLIVTNQVSPKPNF